MSDTAANDLAFLIKIGQVKDTKPTKVTPTPTPTESDE
jgi:hypothetical protein